MKKLLWENANVIAVPTIGAEQGVDKIVAIIPATKSPKYPVWFLGNLFVKDWDNLNSNSPKRFKEKIL